MSERHAKFFNKRVCILLIAGAFICFLWVFFSRRSSSEAPQSVKVVPSPSVSRRPDVPMSVDFDFASFKRTIVENNLFRPLGWSPPVPREPYRLLGTRMSRDTERPAQAILERTSSKQPLIVSVGDVLDAETETEVVSIASKQVVLLTEGRERTLRLETGLWLNPSRVRRASVRHPATVRQPSVRNPRVDSAVRRASRRPVSDPPQVRPLSAWQTREGEVIRIGDARLKNPAKWGLERRFPTSGGD